MVRAVNPCLMALSFARAFPLSVVGPGALLGIAAVGFDLCCGGHGVSSPGGIDQGERTGGIEPRRSQRGRAAERFLTTENTEQHGKEIRMCFHFCVLPGGNSRP